MYCDALMVKLQHWRHRNGFHQLLLGASLHHGWYGSSTTSPSLTEANMSTQESPLQLWKELEVQRKATLPYKHNLLTVMALNVASALQGGSCRCTLFWQTIVHLQ